MAFPQHYEECLADWVPALIRLATKFGTPTLAKDFESAENRFAESSRDEDEFIVSSDELMLSIRFEKHESYFFGRLSGSGTEFEFVKEVLRETFDAQGGKRNKDRPEGAV